MKFTYVEPHISFKGDNILGVAENLQEANQTEAATTAQVMMISSLLSTYTIMLLVFIQLKGLILSIQLN